MKKRLLILVLSLIFGSFASYTTPAQAAVSRRGTQCVISPVGSGWTVSAAVHANGLIYAAITSGGLATGKITIVVLNPATPASTGVGASPGACDIIATLNDPDPRNNFIKASTLQNPAIVKADPSGNIFVGRVTTTGFRIIIIDSTATTGDPLGSAYIRSAHIIGSTSRNNSGGGMDVDNNYLVATHSTDFAMFGRNRYTIVPTSTLLSLPTGITPTQVSATWNTITVKKWKQPWTRLSSGTDAVTALRDGSGRFFVAVAYEKYAIVAAFITPATGAVRNIYTGANGWAELCNNPVKVIGTWCITPSSVLGNDNNLYVAFRTVFTSGWSGERGIRYNTTSQKWESLEGLLVNSVTKFDSFFTTNKSKQTKYGTGIAADSTGQVFIASSHWQGLAFGPLNVAHFDKTSLNPNQHTWVDKTFTSSGKSWGKPALVITPDGGTARLNIFYVRNMLNKPGSRVQIIWIQYSGNIAP
jgi:hypothetical protein